MQKQLSNAEIEEIYQMIVPYHKEHLKVHGVKLPRLKNNKGNYTKDALVLVYLAQGYPSTRPVSKRELTGFVRRFDPSVADVQQARHLGAQKGWYVAAGGRDNMVGQLTRGQYQLVTLKSPYPHFHGHRVVEEGDWEQVKAEYGNRCATCGSEEGKPNIHWSETVTKLQKSHKDPGKPLGPGNIIPQCQKCNRADWIYDERGRVIKLANPRVIKRSDKQVRRAVYRILYEEFGGKKPT